MFSITSMKVTMFASLLALFLVGCSGSSGSSDSSDSGDSNVSETVEVVVEEEANETVLQKSVSLLELDFVGETDVEAGRTVTIRAFINSDEANDLPIYFYLADSEFLEENSTETGVSLTSDLYSLSLGTTHYDTDIVLPNDLSTGDYKVIGVIFPESLAAIDANNTQERMELFEKLYAMTNNSFHIRANDGKPDVEVTYVSIKNNDKVSADAPPRASQGRASVLDLKPNILMFDLAIVNDMVLLNNKDLSFNGRFGVITSNAVASNVSVSACITLLGSCEDVQFYAVNDDNETVYSDDFILSNVKLNEELDVLYNINISETLLESLVKEVINNEEYEPKLRITLFGVDEASTQDATKNVMEVALTFAPVVLSGANVDNSEDPVAPALVNYKITKEMYVDDLKIKDPSLLVKDFELITFEPEDPDPKFELIQPIPAITMELQLAGDIQRVDIESLLDVEEMPDLATEEVTQKVFGKEFELKAESTYFGAHALLLGQGTLDNEGIAAVVNGFVKLKLFGAWESLLEADSYAGINPTSLSRTGYSVDLEALEVNIYSRSQDVASEYGLRDSPLEEIQSRIRANIDTVEEYLHANTGDLLRYNETFSVNKSVSKSTTIMAGVVPVTLSGEVGGSVGVRVATYLYDISRVNARLNPQATIDASASAGVGIDGCSMGVNGELDLIKEDFVAELTAEMTFEGDDLQTTSMLGSLKEIITNTVTGPNGNISIYADYPYLGMCSSRICCCGACVNTPHPCGGCSTAHKTIANFSSTSNRTELLNQHQTLFRIGF